jgi:hypothetical protein
MRHAPSLLALGSVWVFLPLLLVRADDATTVNSTQATAEARQQIAEAQAMADAALARAAQSDGTANRGSATAASGTGSTHHTVSDLIQNNSLRPDDSDSKHHRMGELL